MLTPNFIVSLLVSIVLIIPVALSFYLYDRAKENERNIVRVTAYQNVFKQTDHDQDYVFERALAETHSEIQERGLEVKNEFVFECVSEAMAFWRAP